MASCPPAAEVENTLPYSFPFEEDQCEDPVQLQDQIARVRDAFDQTKNFMSQQAIAELCEYLGQGEWIHDAKRASNHPAYARFMGKGRFKKSLYYPQFFVIQAIFVPDPEGRGILEAVDKLYAEVSKHWGMQATPGVPFFPRLEDSERELRLLLGNHPMLSKQARRTTAPIRPSPAAPIVAGASPGPGRRTTGSPITRDSITITPGPSTSNNSHGTAADSLSHISPYLIDINTKLKEYEQYIENLEQTVKEKEEEVKDRDFQLNNLGYKRRFEDAQQQLHETQQELQDMHHRYRESQMLLSKYEEKAKQVHHHISQSQSFSNRALEAASKIQSLLALGQQQSNKVLNLLSDPIEEFNAAAESSGLAVHDGQRTNKRAREN
ncbi:hypothetical protein FOVSG1_014842 [Fusarium oxysporum f. sp. vasinfectum]